MARVLVFDSGLGGLSILSEVARVLNDASYVYVADTAFYPYGIKPESDLIERVPKVLETMVREFSPDIGVVACNSASTVALDVVRAHVNIPIVGTVPAVKPAAAMSRSKVIGLLATPGTIERDYTDDLIREFALDCQVIRHGSSELVGLAEKKLIDGDIPLGDVHAATQDLFLQDAEGLIDVVVLACTHFPLLADELARSWPDRNIDWIDSGAAIARRVASVLGESGSGRPCQDPQSQAVLTSKPSNCDHLIKVFKAFGLPEPLIHSM